MLDTNIIISAALFPNGRTAEAFFKALQPPYQPVICDYVVDELHRKFGEKFPQRLTELEAFLFNALSFIKLVPTPEESVDIESKIRDSKDRPILEEQLWMPTLICFSPVIRIFWNRQSQIPESYPSLIFWPCKSIPICSPRLTSF